MRNLKFLRIKNKYTQAVLAEKLGIEVSTVTKWETGNSYPRAEMLPEIAKALDCKIDDLFNETKKETA